MSTRLNQSVGAANRPKRPKRAITWSIERGTYIRLNMDDYSPGVFLFFSMYLFKNEWDEFDQDEKIDISPLLEWEPAQPFK